MRVAAWTLGLGVAIAAVPARADVIDGSNPVIVFAVAAGGVGGLTTSIAATVYALDDRTFDSGWVVTSLLSSAICGAFFVSLAADAASNGAELGHFTGMLSFGTFTVWPVVWTVRTAMADVEPGEHLHELDTELESRAPIPGATPMRLTDRPYIPIASFGFRF